MELRVGRLETKLDGVDDRLRGVEIGLATLTERVAHLPSKGFLVTVVLLGFALVGGLVAFQGQLQAFLSIP